VAPPRPSRAEAPQASDLDALVAALAPVEARAAGLPWARVRPWRAAERVRAGGLPVIDLHDLSVAVAVDAAERALDAAPGLAAGGVVLITGRGRRSGGVSRLRVAVLERARQVAAARGWRAGPDGPGRVRVVVDPSRAARAEGGLGPLFWLLVVALILGLAAVLLGGCVAPPSPPPPGPVGPGWLALPIADPTAISSVVGVDHDPVDHADTPGGGLLCTAHDGSPFPACYDGHDGTDFLLDGGFPAMDDGSVGVRAAADGLVVSTHDGEYDRCHAQGTGVSCDGHPMVGNHVILEHAGGWQTRYWHLKRGSVAVAVGEVVPCGAALGRVGSSGFSSAPHLHFELTAPGGAVVDPYAGAHSQPDSLWRVEQGPEGLPGRACGLISAAPAARHGP
jgi:hypothetical protein